MSIKEVQEAGIVEQQWEELLTHAPFPTSPISKAIAKKAFYAGVTSGITLFLERVGSGDSIHEAVASLDSIQQEIMYVMEQ